MREELIRLKNAPITDAIAELRLTVEFPDGRRESQHIKIGRPILVTDMYGCQIEGVGPILMSSPSVGDNSFQALTMALAWIRCGIHSFVEKSSCKIFYGDDHISLEVLDNVLFADGMRSIGDEPVGGDG